MKLALREETWLTRAIRIYGRPNILTATSMRSKVQHTFSINTLAGILRDRLFRPYLLPECFNGAKYLVFSQYVHSDLLQGILPCVHQDMWFMHDGAPAYFSIAVRNYLDATYPGIWIGYGGHVAWPSRSPELNTLDFFFCATWKRLFRRFLCMHGSISQHELLSLQKTSRTHWVYLNTFGNP